MKRAMWLMLVVAGMVRAESGLEDVLAGRFAWTASAPLIASKPEIDHSPSIKDPSVVFHDGRWHVFTTIRPPTPARMEYLSFTNWAEADKAPRQLIALVDTYHCAPQVFFFRPDKRWYLIYQWNDKSSGEGGFGPAWSRMDDVAKPETLSKPAMLFPRRPAHVPHWIDFWVIGNEHDAFLFFTGDDGTFWRSQTPLADFPVGWSDPVKVLELPRNEFFEASHTYRLKGADKYLTLVEAIGPGDRRFYKAYVADRLDGDWQPVAGTWEKPFASLANVKFPAGTEPWTDSISHGELLREGSDETMTVDPARLRFLFQGCTADERKGKSYGQYPWRLGLLEPAK